ncbi:terminase large subunit [Loigolactobacillus bifermentans]|uniref:Large terminase subunit n=1 Tax=Loigolactobacillus bifermentans DSM 20003 TaxID=1423726 RepID=A0A0R1H2Z2_9LACO|nr:terminase TerL endonuclease subunit [Loigolactobacillus bifermentans]KRK40902.1 large terminase subunit [Loigolactobacillus bifermentans DSM 20003]QGG59653.1 terminase large subunit [Loigolactobacillus bifermentans]
MKFTDPTPNFIKRVLNGRLITCDAVLLAVKRQENDLKRTDWRWTWNPELAGKAVKFMEMLPEPKTGKAQPLAPFQKFIIGCIYGWVDKDDPTIRRFTDVFISMARKNGKSLLISGVILYEFLFGKNPANKRQLYTAANDRKQAGIVFGMVKDRLRALCKKDAEIKRMVRITRDEIENLNDGSTIRAFSRDAGLVDGYEPHVAVVDEYANAKTTDMIETLASGQLLLPSYLTFIISTAGFDMNVPMFTQNYPYAKKVLRGEIDAERYFAFIAEMDSAEAVDDPEKWIEANPLMDVDVLYNQIHDYLADKLASSRADGTLNSKLVKNFNVWRQATEDSYMNFEDWKQAELVEKPDLRGARVWFGIDVGRTSDLFAITWLVLQEGYWYLDGYAFIASKNGLDAKIKTDRIDYRAVEKRGEGEITQLESGIIDNDRVYEWLEDFIERNDIDVQAICYDPYQFGPLLTTIEKNHSEWNMVSVRQGTMTLSMPTKQFKDDVICGKVKHSNNELMTAAMMNAVLMSDNNGVRINKNKYSNKIDMADAALDAYAVAFTEDIDNYLDDESVFSDDFGF